MTRSWPKLALVLGVMSAGGVAGPAAADGLRAAPGPYSYNYGPIYYPGPGPVAVGAPPIYRVPPPHMPPPFTAPIQAQRLGVLFGTARGPSCYAQPRWVWVETDGYRRRNVVVCY